MQKWELRGCAKWEIQNWGVTIIGDLTQCTFMYIYHNLICVASWHVRTGTVYTELCPHLYTVNTGEECVYNWSCLYMKLHSAKIHAVLGPSSHWSNVPFGGVLHVKLNVLPYLYPSWQSPFVYSLYTSSEHFATFSSFVCSNSYPCTIPHLLYWRVWGKHSAHACIFPVP